MARFVKGDIVVLPFPFSDLSASKKRPALVLTGLTGDDIILCQITSKNIRDEYSIQLHKEHFVEGALKRDSNIRPNRIFTAESSIVLYKVGTINTAMQNSVRDKLYDLLR